MKSHALTLSVLALATPLLAQSSTVVNMFGLIGGNYSASVIAVQSSTTTLQLFCPARTTTEEDDSSSPTDQEADFLCSSTQLIVTTASDFFGAVVSDVDNGDNASGTISCSLAGTSSAVCTQQAVGTVSGAPFSTSVLYSLSAPDDFENFPLTITGGLDKLGAGGSTPTGSAASETGAHTTGTHTGTGAAPTSSHGAGVPMRVNAAAAGLLGVAAAALAL